MRTIWKRTLALVLSAVLILSMNGVPAYATDVETGDSAACPHHVHDESCGYDEDGTCNFDPADCEICNSEEGGAQEQCSCLTLCTESDINSDCPVCGAEGADLTLCQGEAAAGGSVSADVDAQETEGQKTILSWEWIGSDCLTDGRLLLPGVSETNPITFETVCGMLPAAVSVQTEGSDTTEEIQLKWSCPEFGASVTSGTYTFTAELPEGYQLAEGTQALAIEVDASCQVSTLANDSTAATKPEGEGTEASPYQISTAAELYWFAALVNGTLEGVEKNAAAWATLTDDINLSGENWTPIGSESTPYTGTFDGAGYTISGMVVNNPDSDYQGFVGILGPGGTIQNLTLDETCTVSGGYGGYYVGGVCGWNNGGTITNCSNRGTVSGSSNVGGVCGENNGGTITNCSNSGKVSGSGSGSNVGGVCGRNNGGTITNCSNSGEITGTSSIVGGVCGSNDYEDRDAIIENCTNTGKVSGSSQVGGVCGYNGGTGAFNVTIENCTNTGAVSGSSKVGGVCGYNCDTIIDCYWLDTAYDIGIGSSDTDASDEVEAKTAAQFASGEVTYLLNESKSEGDLAWYQNLGDDGDAFPVLDSTHGTVYPTYRCDNKTTIISYNNTGVKYGGHSYGDDGFCIYGCGQYKPAEEKDGVYQITNAGQLFWFAALVNGDTTHAEFDEQNAAANAVLTDDITIPENYNWTPIGSESTPYTGTFDGAGYTISGMTIENAESYSGLFGNVTGTVKNFTVTGSITVSSDATDLKVGGAVGSLGTASAGGTVSGVTSGVDITVTSGKGHIGGVVGSMPENSSPTVESCVYIGTITSSVDADCVAGVVGYIRTGTIQNCANRGQVSVSGSGNVGGVLGYCNNTGISILNCYNSGTISADVTDNVGAIVGQNKNTQATVSSCYYLTGSAAKGQGQLTGDAAGTAVKTAEAFASGEVTYLLNGSTSEGDLAWYQNLGDNGDKYPVLDSTHGIVYLEDENYTNTLTVISVDITWGDLSFTYSDGTWNPATHTYEGGGWTADTENGNTVQVENTGNTEVSVSYTYTVGETGITGSFTDGENPVSEPVSLPANESSTVYLALTGKPEEPLTNAPIGSVTVTIGGESE